MEHARGLAIKSQRQENVQKHRNRQTRGDDGRKLHQAGNPGHPLAEKLHDAGCEVRLLDESLLLEGQEGEAVDFSNTPPLEIASRRDK